MTSPTLHKVIDAIRSDKSTQRHQGLSNLREYFERDRVIRNIDEKGDGQPWIHIYQAVFSAVLNEKEACLKKGLDRSTDAALKKLGSVSDTLRWFTERTYSRITYKCVKALINHCLEIVVYRHQLLAPVAFPSLQILRVILSHPPHREHIKAGTWLEIFSLSFGILIEDDISTYFTIEEDEEMEVEQLALEDSMDVDEELQDTSEIGTGTPSRRRRRRSTPLQPIKPPKMPRERPRHTALSREQICAAELVHLLLASPYAVFKDEELPNLTRAILNKFRRFLEMFPQLTTAHHHIIHGIILTLTHAEMNCNADVVDFGRKTWNLLISLWQKKDNVVKEGLVMIFTILLPFVTQDHLAKILLDQSEIRKLQAVLTSEMEQCFQSKGMTLDDLRLEVEESPCNNRPFCMHTFQSGLDFTPKQAHYWAVLELEADCAAKLVDPYWSPQPEPGRAKRRKHENPVDSWLSSISSERDSTSARVARLQILLFFIERHHATLSQERRRSLLSGLTSAANSGNVDVQVWAILCLTTLAAWQEIENGEKGGLDWHDAWKLSLHLSTNPQSCRAACHLAYVLMKGEVSGLSEAQLLKDVENLVRDLAVRGPSYPYDSVCRFLHQCLHAAARDVRLFRLNLQEKVLWWLSDRWKPATGSDFGGKTFPRVHFLPNDMLQLLAEIASCGSCPTVYFPQFPVDGFLPGIMAERARRKVILDYMLHAQLPVVRPIRQASSSRRSDHTRSSCSASREQHSRHWSTANAIAKSIESELELLQRSEDLPKEFSAQRLRQTIGLAVVALLFDALLIHNGMESDERLQTSISDLLARILPKIFLHHWSTTEQQFLIQGFLPLVTDRIPNSDIDWQAMIQPTEKTGIRHTLLQRFRIHDVEESMTTKELLCTLWRMPKVFECFFRRFRAFRKVVTDIMEGEAISSINNYGTSDADLFGSFVVGAAGGGHSDTTHQTAAAIGVIVLRLLLRIPYFQSSKPARDKTTFNELQSISVRALPVVTRLLVEEARIGYIHVGKTSWGLIHGHIESHIRNYQIARDPDFHILVMDFLRISLKYWLSASAGEDVLSSAMQLMHHFADLFHAGALSSWRGRVAICRLFSDYLEVDPREGKWHTGEEDTEDEGNGQGSKQTERPSVLLPTFSRDEDTRVRFSAATICANFVATSSDRKVDPASCYGVIHSELPSELGATEVMLTRILLLGNLVVASSAVRRGSVWHLLELSVVDKAFTRHVKPVFDHAVARMGLEGTGSFFDCYKYQIAFSIDKLGKTLLAIPPQLIGFQSDTDCAKCMYGTIIPILLVYSGPGMQEESHRTACFNELCKKVERPPSELFQECYHDMVGRQIVFLVSDFLEQGDALNVDVVFKEAKAFISNFTKMAGYPESNVIEPESCVDRILLSMLRMVSDIDYSEDGPISNALKEFEGGSLSAQVFQHLNTFRDDGEFMMHHPIAPWADARSVLQSFRVLQKFTGDFDNSSVVYHIIHTLLAEIDQSTMVNEQLRLIHSLCIWLAVNAGRMSDPTLLRLIMHGSLVLMRQIDLTRSAQSILAWSLALLAQQALGEGFVRSIFIAVAHLASDFGGAPEDVRCAALSGSLFDWIESEASRLIDHAVFGGEVLEALCTWPRSLSESLSRACKSRSKFGAIRTAINLNLPFLEKHKFLRQIDRPSISIKPSHQWSEQDLWRIKRSVPSIQEMTYVDAHGLASVFFKYGELSLSKADEIHTISSHHLQIIRGTKHLSTKSPKPSIVIHLMEMLYSRTYAQVHQAYHTLRLLLGGEFDGFEFRDLLDCRIEAELLAAYSLAGPKPAPAPLASLEQMVASHTDYSSWITGLSSLLASSLAQMDQFYGHLISILKKNVSFARQMLPILVHQSLTSNNREEARKLLSSLFLRVLNESTGAKLATSSILASIQYLRHFHDDLQNQNTWLDLDFLLLARGAIASCAFTTALMFIELAAEVPPSDGGESGTVETMLYEIYGHIQEPDGFYGIHDKDRKSSLIRRYEHERQWDKASQMLGAQFEVDKLRPQAFDGIVKSLHFRGFHKQASLTLESAHPRSHQTSPTSISYDLGWRTATWDLPLTGTEHMSDLRLYTALRSLHCDRNPVIVNQVCQEALVAEVNHLGKIADEDLHQIENCLQRVICLKEVNDWVTGPEAFVEIREMNPERLKSLANINDKMKFETLEKIMLTRLSLLHSVFRLGKSEQLGTIKSNFSVAIDEVEHECHRMLSSSARLSGDLQVALNFAVRAQALDPTPSADITEELAEVLWQKNEQKAAVDLICDLEDTLKESKGKDQIKRARLLARIGEWSSEARLEKPTDILERYFQAAMNVVSKGPPEAEKESRQIFESYALFAHRQYTSISSSPELARLNLYMERKRDEIRLLEESIKSARSSRGKSTVPESTLQHHRKRAVKLLSDDASQAEGHNNARDMFLRQAIDMYSRSLCASDLEDIQLVIRLCSLWYSNFGDSTYDEVARKAILRIPSHKFVFLAHQLTARLSDFGSQPSGSPKTLYDLVLRICEEHPFHILPQIYALRQGTASQEASMSKRSQSSISTVDLSQVNRQKAAVDVVNRLKLHARSSQRVRDVDMLCDAALEWATHSIPKNDKGGAIPNNSLLRKLANLKVPVITSDFPIDPSLRYENMVCIARYKSQYKTAGGNAVPKICECVGSNGKIYKQLFKGQGDDDLRQDAVMEQVFQLMNVILEEDRETGRRKLHIRTYKVIPLASQAGILEFVGNTKQIREWLQDAHKRYRPGDMTHKQTQLTLQAARDAWKSERDNKKCIDAFLKVRERFGPVMRHFFTERYKGAGDWFSTRLNYSRSVAVTSIAGHILGLGDRHIGNILLDYSTGEVVHIDLGIAFEQGKLLPVPELVPFRLTADMVDGFGISKTEGVFRRCAEQTLRVLRENSEIIITVLDVFKYDPLHSWTMNPVKKLRLQGEQQVQKPPITPISETGTMISAAGAFGTGIQGTGIDLGSDPVDESCERALGSVSRKLDKKLSIEYTVNELIVAAMDASNLGCIFHGWSPQF